jgi:hypothetical protein
MKKIIILNGPPRCGKDVAANAIQQYLGTDTVAHLKLSTPLKTIAMLILGGDPVLHEQLKDVPTNFKSLSYREMQIIIFNELARSLGIDWLGQIMVRSILAEESDYIVISDGGRPEDVAPMLRLLPSKEVMILQIMRNNCNFTHDIRMYLSDNRAIMRHIVNDDLDTFKNNVIDVASAFFGD